jgi:hypothetical protein
MLRAIGRCGVSRARDSVTRLQLQSTLPLTPFQSGREDMLLARWVLGVSRARHRMTRLRVAVGV